ncbi:unnamed protein product [Protopolystoma xenopodis]|uniref:Regulator of chromosome condensation 1/beta-lactamase-inhibitor protein II n=1 Tax=Protopolystoma xenopodis TaxID=117903 RepID=A0A448WXM8_9PLAT|nr:unnamed protein product [Protopolystoma xenopodis]
MGHNQKEICVPLPRKVFELMGNAVCQLECGRMHTLALVPVTGRIYSFGAGGEGQLGLGDLLNRSGPTIVRGE